MSFRKSIFGFVSLVVIGAHLAAPDAHGFGGSNPRPTPTPTTTPTPTATPTPTPTVTPSPSPTPVQYFNFVIEVFDGDPALGRRIQGASVSVDSESRTTDGNGFSHFWAPQGDRVVRVNAAGFVSFEIHYNLTRESNGVYPSTTNPSLRVSLIAVVTGNPPTATITSGPPRYTNVPTQTFAFTAAGQSPFSFECSMDELTGGTVTPCASPKSYSGLSEGGSHAFRVYAIDRFGRRSTETVSRFTIDTSAPSVTVTASPPSTSTSTSASFEFTSADAKSGIAGFMCKLDSLATVGCTSPKTYTGLSAGAHVFKITVSDNAGNVSDTVTVNWNVNPGPGELVPAPNHAMKIGYYYADGRYGDYTSEVFPYTNLYIAIPRGYVTESDWRPQFRESLQRASDAGKDIILLLPAEVDWNETLDITAPFWSKVRVVEIAHEEDLTVAQAEARAAAVNSRLDLKGLAHKTLGMTLTQSQSLGTNGTGAGISAPSIGWIGIEAYVDPPGSATSATNVNQLNTFLDQAKARVPAGKQIGMIMQSYDRNGQWTNMTTLTDLQLPAYLKSYNDTRVSMLLMFAYARPGGARDHASLASMHRRIGYRIMGLPDPGPTCVGGPCVDQVSQSFIQSRWNGVQNGWFPAVSADGRYVGYGFGHMTIVDLNDKIERVLDPAGFNATWIRPNVFTWTRESGTGMSIRFEIVPGEWQARQTTDDPHLISGNEFDADAGYWATWRAGRLVWNGRVIVASGSGAGVSVSGNQMVAAADGDHTAINLWTDGVFTKRYEKRTAVSQLTFKNNHIVYGGYGPVWGIKPDGTQQDLTVTPWRWEGSAEVFMVDGQPWVASSTWNNEMDKGFILLRPWGEKESIIIQGGASGLSARANNGTITVAFNSDKGQLTVLKLPTTAPRQLVRIP